MQKHFTTLEDFTNPEIAVQVYCPTMGENWGVEKECYPNFSKESQKRTHDNIGCNQTEWDVEGKNCAPHSCEENCDDRCHVVKSPWTGALICIGCDQRIEDELVTSEQTRDYYEAMAEMKADVLAGK